MRRIYVCYSFGKWLRQAREEVGLSRRRLAQLANANQSYVARLENAQHAAPSRDMAAKLARALKLPMSDALVAAGYLPEGCAAVPAHRAGDGRPQEIDQESAQRRGQWGFERQLPQNGDPVR